MGLRYPADFSDYSPCLIRHGPFQNAYESIQVMRRRGGNGESVADERGICRA